MTTLDDLQARLDQGLPAGVSGIPAAPSLWGIESAEVVFRRRGGIVEAYLRGIDGRPAHGLGAPSALGRQLAIGPAMDLPEALERTERLLGEGPQRVRQTGRTFLASAGSMLCGLTLVALGDLGSFQGLAWRCIDGEPRPVLRAAEHEYCGLAFWVAALDGACVGEDVEYDPSILLNLSDLIARMRAIWTEA